MFVFINIGYRNSIEKERWVVWPGFFIREIRVLWLAYCGQDYTPASIDKPIHV